MNMWGEKNRTEPKNYKCAEKIKPLTYYINGGSNYERE